jgi:hypothetical protein
VKSLPLATAPAPANDTTPPTSEPSEPLSFYAPSVDIPSAETRRELSRAIVTYLGRLGYRVHASLGRRGPRKADATKPLVYVAAKDGRRLWFVTDEGAGEFTVGAVTHGDETLRVPYLKWGGPVRPEQTAYRLAAAFGAV